MSPVSLQNAATKDPINNITPMAISTSQAGSPKNWKVINKKIIGNVLNIPASNTLTKISTNMRTEKSNFPSLYSVLQREHALEKLRFLSFIVGKFSKPQCGHLFFEKVASPTGIKVTEDIRMNKYHVSG